jgi:hypothetical protein
MRAVNEHGPFETERQARETAAVRTANAAFDANPAAGKHIPHHLRILMDACSAAGVFVGTYDLRILTWLANYEDTTCAVIAGLIRRAAQLPEGTARPAGRTTVHWGVRYPGERGVRGYDGEEDAREHLLNGEVVVFSEVTAGPWTEVPEPAEDGSHD